MPLGGWWGDVLFCVKEDASGALGSGAGDSVEIEHCVGVEEHKLGISVDDREGDEELKRGREGAECSTLLRFIYISNTPLHRGRAVGGET